ncbi:hypothetical protein N7G274_001528 [Stereocaulon virgatum]|uniref:HCNGP-domain-containing protein n=1 Tax=Stereocaulon virgatum TaxID=373712 RepID=A0ABR4AMP6_9LECA
MSGLVAYGSSDEEEAMDEVNKGQQASETPNQAENVGLARQTSPYATVNGSSRPPQPDNGHFSQTPATNGPMIGPAGPPHPCTPEDSILSAPSSPYTSQRATIRNLTMPTNPNLEIPLSPPGSPNPGADQKFAHFLELKKQGVHFNAKLASSSALKNPSLLPKLMDFAGLDEQQQYATTLSAELWNPADFPEWAYKEELLKSQQSVLKKKEQEKSKAPREGIDFAGATNSSQPSKGGIPGFGTGSKAIKGNALDRVMAGLDSERRASLPSTNLERRRGRVEGVRSGGSSRSPKRRKRSRSR